MKNLNHIKDSVQISSRSKYIDYKYSGTTLMALKSKLTRDILENIIIKIKTSTIILNYIKYVYVVIILNCKIKRIEY